jgi:hypothetical protein
MMNNVAGGKDPWGDRAEGTGKREGMAGKTGPKEPGGVKPRDKVRELRRRLWAAAKRAPGRRFHALYDHLGRSDVLQEAWRRVRRNRGAAGVDSQSIHDVEQYGVERFLEELGAVLRAGEYRATVVRRQYIPKADGRQRPLGIPTVRDRVVQMAAKLTLEPIFEADFLPCSYGFRPKRKRTVVGTGAQAPLFPTALAVTAHDAAHSPTGEGADPTVAVPRGYPHGHRGSEPALEGLGSVLSHGQCDNSLHTVGQLRLAASAVFAPETQGSRPQTRRGRPLDERVL